jgi:outer membrane receptor protein involved in Fe transport
MNILRTILFAIAMLSFQIGHLFSQYPARSDTLQKTPNVIGGIYDRPYIFRIGGQIAIGGYAEMNSNFVREDGIEEGLSFEARRFNVFFYSSISERVKLTSELEFEHGTEEIALETAIVDAQFHPAINLRAGVLLSPLGKFNIAHDSPRYDLIDRPLVSTQIIPATLSEVGVGFFGAFFPSPYDRLTYEIYAVNGLGDGVVGGSGDGTRIPMGKPEAFEEDNNGSPAFTGRLAMNPRFGGELGVSFHTGFYNRYKIEGEQVDDQRRLTIVALDAEYRWRRLRFRGEAALAKIEVPESLSEMFADQQKGFYGELGYTLLKRPLLNFPEATLTLVTRYDYIDLNDGTFSSTGQNIGDSVKRLTAGLSFRPTAETSIRLSYARNWSRDVFNNLSHSMNIQFGVATYF